MARTKTAYRHAKEPEKPPAAESEPEIKIDGEPVEPDVAARIEPPAEPKVSAAVDAAAEADASKMRLLHQIEELKRSEELQRQHQAAAQAARQMSPREQKLAHWKAAGMPERDLSFLSQHPEMIDHDAITSAASADVMAAGIPYEAADYPERVKQAFDRRLSQLRGQAAAAPPPSPPPPETETPKFFEPPPPKQQTEPSESHMVSAPVSRQAPSAGSYTSTIPPSRVHLTNEEIAIAQATGVSLREYAEGKIRLEQEKRSGLRQR